MKKILVIYFSGAGSTKKVANLMCNRLLHDCEVDIFSIESKEIPNINNYDALIVGTPTYHAIPSKLIMDFFNAISPLAEVVPAFIYNTRGLFSFNTNRALAKVLQAKNIFIIMDVAYRSPASDGSILAPFVKRFFEFEKDIEKKIDCDCTTFLALLNKENYKFYIPRFQLSSFFNVPNKAIGQRYTAKIYLHEDRCSKCGKCNMQCPHSAFSSDINDYPIFDSKKCERLLSLCTPLSNFSIVIKKKGKAKKDFRWSGKIVDRYQCRR